ncbi:MAG TPA: replicative DNA helicase [Alphaproteobacteria bacterium]|nr:replicative DNA helicase [Alphaproteobacteria bacterium]
MATLTKESSTVTPLRSAGDESGVSRTPPHNHEAEMALLGAILASNRAFEKVSEYLRPEHFTDARHQRIFDACAKLIERGQLANSVTLKAYFEQDKSLDEIGGPKYLARLEGSAISIVNAGEYGRIVHDLYLRRELIGLGTEVVNRAFEVTVEESGMQQIEEAERGLYDLATTGQFEGGFVALTEAMKDAVESAEAAFKRSSHVTGVTTGFVDLDRKLGGLHPSDLVILAGRPSMGKTALATNIAFNAAKAYREERAEDGTMKVVEGAKVAFFSLEMSAEQLANRILAEQTGIDSNRIRQGEVSRDDFPRFVETLNDLQRLPLFIDDTPALSVSALRTRARRLKRQHGLGLVVIDYLQLVQAGGVNRNDGRVQEVSEITRGLKALAKELEVPVLALSQLSRAVEQREDKRPQLADLRESGSIEQDADVVMFIYREEYYLSRAEPKQRAEETTDKYTERYEKWVERCAKVANVAEVNIAKQRHGPIGTVGLQFEGALTRFGNLERTDYAVGNEE